MGVCQNLDQLPSRPELVHGSSSNGFLLASSKKKKKKESGVSSSEKFRFCIEFILLFSPQQRHTFRKTPPYCTLGTTQFDAYLPHRDEKPLEWFSWTEVFPDLGQRTEDSQVKILGAFVPNG